MLLTTTGAKSGKERTAVLGFGKDGDRHVVIASNNGAPRSGSSSSTWCRTSSSSKRWPSARSQSSFSSA